MDLVLEWHAESHSRVIFFAISQVAIGFNKQE